MKKIIILMLAMTMVFALSVAVSAGDLEAIELCEDVVLTQGTGLQTVTIPVNFAPAWIEEWNDIYNFQVFASYDDGIALTSEAWGNVADMFSVKGSNMTIANSYNIGCTNADVTNITEGVYVEDTDSYDTATITNLTFTVPTSVAGTYTVTVTDASYIYDADKVKVYFAPVSVTITVEAADVDAIVPAGMNLLLDGGIGAKVYFGYDETVNASDLSLAVTVNNSDKGVSTPAVDLVIDDTLANTAYFVVAVAPKDIDNITIDATVTDGANTASASDISVATCIDAYTSSSDATLSALASALEVYCAQADSYFGDQSATPTTLTAKEKAAVKKLIPTSLDNKVVGDLTFESTSLILNDKVTLRHYFAVAEGANLADYTVEGAELVAGSAGYAYVEFANIVANALGTAQTVTVSKGGESVTISFSPLNYVALNYLNKVDTALAGLVNALYKYNVAAVAYAA